MSADGRNILMLAEGVRLKPYNDKTGKTITEYIPEATIGVGHLIAKSEWDKYKNGITQEEAGKMLRDDLRRFESIVNISITSRLNQNQFDALVIFAFNIGVDKFKKSSAVKLVNNPQANTPYTNLESAWKAYRKDNGIINDGLIKRRAIEWELYLMPEGI